MAENLNCDGSGPHAAGEVRVYTLSTVAADGGSNLILCRNCWNTENRYRAARAKQTGHPDWWPQEDWNTAKVSRNESEKRDDEDRKLADRIDAKRDFDASQHAEQIDSEERRQEEQS